MTTASRRPGAVSGTGGEGDRGEGDTASTVRSGLRLGVERTVRDPCVDLDPREDGFPHRDTLEVSGPLARDQAELITDGAQAIRERLEAVTGERTSAFEGIGEAVQREHEKEGKSSLDRQRQSPEASTPPPPEREIEPALSRQKAPEPEPPDRGKRVELELGL